MSNYLKGNVDEELSLGTLAAVTLVGQDFDEVLAERSILTSLVATWAMQEFTPIAGVGPITVGIAHSDYTDVEIEQFIENTGSWNPASKVQSKEIGSRLIRKVGTFFPRGTGASNQPDPLNDGRPIKTKLNWTLITGSTLKVWAYNEGSGAIATTVPIVSLQGHVNMFLL